MRCYERFVRESSDVFLDWQSKELKEEHTYLKGQYV